MHCHHRHPSTTITTCPSLPRILRIRHLILSTLAILPKSSRCLSLSVALSVAGHAPNHPHSNADRIVTYLAGSCGNCLLLYTHNKKSMAQEQATGMECHNVRAPANTGRGGALINLMPSPCTHGKYDPRCFKSAPKVHGRVGFRGPGICFAVRPAGIQKSDVGSSRANDSFPAQASRYGPCQQISDFAHYIQRTVPCKAARASTWG